MSANVNVSAVRDLDQKIETILTQFDTHYIWDYEIFHEIPILVDPQDAISKHGVEEA